MRIQIMCGILGLVGTTLLPAQARADQGQVWFEAGISHSMTSRTELGFDQHLRFGGDGLDSIMPEVRIIHRPRRWLRFDAGYRFSYQRDEDGVLGYRHRLFGDMRARTTGSPWRFEYRFRLQQTLRGLSNEDGARYKARNRGGVVWLNKSRWTPKGTIEFFHGLGNNNGIELRKLRLTFGAEYGRGKREYDLFYRFETPYNDPGQATLHILGVAGHMDI